MDLSGSISIGGVESARNKLRGMPMVQGLGESLQSLAVQGCVSPEDPAIACYRLGLIVQWVNKDRDIDGLLPKPIIDVLG